MKQWQIASRSLRLILRYPLRSVLLALSAALGVSGAVCSMNYGASGTEKVLEQIRRLGTNVREIRTVILDSLEQSDNGRAFKAALEERGLMLANGDRRDCFVVVDQEAGHHALNKKLTGMTLAERGCVSPTSTAVHCRASVLYRFSVSLREPVSPVHFSQDSRP